MPATAPQRHRLALVGELRGGDRRRRGADRAELEVCGAADISATVTELDQAQEHAGEHDRGGDRREAEIGEVVQPVPSSRSAPSLRSARRAAADISAAVAELELDQGCRELAAGACAILSLSRGHRKQARAVESVDGRTVAVEARIVGITIYWFEVEAAALEFWRRSPGDADSALYAAWSGYVGYRSGEHDAFTCEPPVLRVVCHDYKARVSLADGVSSEAGDGAHDALQGDENLQLPSFGDGALRAYSVEHLERVISALPDDPRDVNHDIRSELHRIAVAGHGLVSLWS